MTKKPKRSYKIADVKTEETRIIVTSDLYEGSKKVNTIKEAFDSKLSEKDIEKGVAKSCEAWFGEQDFAKEQKKVDEAREQAQTKKNNLIGKGKSL
jgi:hypothetical protein